MESDSLHKCFDDFRWKLNTSLNYYGALWTRSRYWLWVSRFLDFIAAAIAGAALMADLNSWLGYVSIAIALISWLKTESFVERRVGVLSKQYRQVNRLLSCLPDLVEDETVELYNQIRNEFMAIEEGDLPTIQCLYAVCENETRKKFGESGYWNLSWFQRYIGVYFRCVRCDGKLQLKD